MQRLIAISLAVAGTAVAHGDHGSQAPMVNENANWMTKHMAGMQASPLVRRGGRLELTRLPQRNTT